MDVIKCFTNIYKDTCNYITFSESAFDTSFEQNFEQVVVAKPFPY